MSKRLVVLGAGVSGLSAAYHAATRVPGCSVTVIEAEETIGGLCSTHNCPSCMSQYFANGSLLSVDYGIHTLFTDKPFVQAVYKQLSPVEQPRRAKILFSKDLSVDYPFQAYISQLPPVHRDEIARDWKSPATPDGTFLGGFAASYGRAASDYFFYPYNRKKFGSALDIAGAGYGVRKHLVYTPEDIDELVKAPVRPEGHCPTVAYCQPTIERLPRMLAEPVTNIMFGWKAVRVDTARRLVWIRDSATGTTFKPVAYDVLISTVPNTFYSPHGSSVKALALFPLQEKPFPDTFEAVTAPYAAIVVPTDKLLCDAHWMLIPGMDYRLVRVANLNLIRHVLGERHTMLIAEMAASGALPASATHASALIELADLGVIKEPDGLEYYFNYKYPSYPVYSTCARQSLDAAIAELKRIGVYCIGRFGRWEYLDADECIIDGATAVLEAFR